MDDTIRFAKLDLDGAGGGDTHQAHHRRRLIGITDEAISLNFSKIEIDYKEFSELNLIGGALDSKVEIKASTSTSSSSRPQRWWRPRRHQAQHR